MLRGKSQRTPQFGQTCKADVGRTPNSTALSATKHPSHCSIRVFPVSCLKHTLRGKAFEDEKRSKVTPTATYTDAPSGLPEVFPAAEVPLEYVY
jgi:hypothetical protein